jgi:hypothetical protein
MLLEVTLTANPVTKSPATRAVPVDDSDVCIATERYGYQRFEQQNVVYLSCNPVSWTVAQSAN